MAERRVERMQDATSSIHEDLKQNEKALPQLKVLRAERRKTLIGLMENFQKKEKHLSNLESQIQQMEIQLDQRLKIVEQSKGLCESAKLNNQNIQKTINEDELKIIEILDNHDSIAFEIAELFRSAPERYSRNRLQNETDALMKKATSLRNELNQMEEELSSVRQVFAKPSEESVMIESLDEIIRDKVKNDDILKQLTHTYTELKNVKENLESEILQLKSKEKQLLKQLHKLK